MSPTEPRPAADLEEARALLVELKALRATVVAEGDRQLDEWARRDLRPGFAESAKNLSDYLAFRRRDLRELQERLMRLGLTSLGRCESRVRPSLDAAIRMLSVFCGEPDPGPVLHFFRGVDLLREHADAVFGAAPPPRQVRILVTLDPSYAHGFPLDDLARAGADAIRINCGHDERGAWAALVRAVVAAGESSGRRTRVCMDLSGPRCRTAEVQMVEEDARLEPGSVFFLRSAPGLLPPSVIGQAVCTLPEAVAALRVGDRVYVDEGKLQATVIGAEREGVRLKVSRAPDKGFKLRSDKGINLPDTPLVLPALTPKDLADLETVVQLADIVGYSFVQSGADMGRLHDALDQLGASPDLAVIAKIETRRAIENLPEIIIAGAGRRPLAVMIARGDLAVEIGFTRLAEVQEELLWLCEAAHTPVVWATQVMDRLVRKGYPTRAEVTDAAMAERAECVMLNKGPHLLEGVRLLSDVLGRMEGHQAKKTSRLRALRAWAPAIP